MASGFRFEALMRLRKAREDQQKRVVAMCLQNVEKLRQRRSALEDEVRDRTADLRADLVGDHAAIDGMRWGRHWLARLRREMLATDAGIAERRAVLAHERSVLGAARKETRVLERLKERQAEAAREEEARRERKEADDLNIARFAFARLQSEDAAR